MPLAPASSIYLAVIGSHGGCEALFVVRAIAWLDLGCDGGACHCHHCASLMWTSMRLHRAKEGAVLLVAAFAFAHSVMVVVVQTVGRCMLCL